MHTLAIKDMAGLLRPRAATTLISALRCALPMHRCWLIAGLCSIYNSK